MLELNLKSVTQFLSRCSRTKNLLAIQQLHGHLLTIGLLFISPNLQTQLLFAYTTCFRTNSQLKTFTQFSKCLNPKNPLIFNSIISHFSKNGFDSLALHTFSFMHLNNVYVDSYALCSSVKSASCLKDASVGKMMHGYVEKSGWFASVFVGSALVDLYTKLLCVHAAGMVFDEIPVKNTVCVNALLMGYCEEKLWVSGIELVRRMQLLSLRSDNFTLSATLRMCIGMSSLELGKQVHGSVIRNIYELGADVFLQSLLIEMYGKCGLVKTAREIFDMVGYVGLRKSQRDVILWTSMLGVYGKNGNYKQVIYLYEKMLIEGITPDGVAYLTVISACSHTGQVDLGMSYFESMTQNHGLVANKEHYSCLVDLLCRAGELEKAWKLISDMPNTGNECSSVTMWGALLSACNEFGNVNMGELAAEKALELEPKNIGVYVLLSNMYARNEMWDEIELLRELMIRRGLRKENGWSLIDAGS